MKGLSGFLIKSDIKVYSNEVENKVYINDESLEIEFNHPRGIEIYKEMLFIANGYLGRVEVVDLSGKLLYAIGDTVLEELYGFAIDGDSIFIINRSNRELLEFSIDGELKRVYKNDIGYAKSICLDDKNIYIVAENFSEIRVIERKSGEESKIFLDGINPTDFIKIEDLFVIADKINRRVVVVNSFGVVENILAKEGYYSLLEFENGIVYIYDERSGEFKNLEWKIENRCEELNSSENLAYYYYKKGEKERALTLFKEEELFLKKEYSINRDICKDLKMEYFYKKQLEYSNNKEEYYNLLEGGDKYSFDEVGIIDIVDKSDKRDIRAFYLGEDYLYIGRLMDKLIIKTNFSGEVIEFFKTELEIDKITLYQEMMFMLRYNDRGVDIVSLKDKKIDESLGEKSLIHPVDISIFNNKIYVLDSYKKSVMIYGMNFKLKREHYLGGEQYSSIIVKEENIYILDQRRRVVEIYSENFDFEREITVSDDYKNLDCMVVSKKYIFLSEDINGRVIKLNLSGEFLGERSDFFKVRGMALKDEKLYVCDYGKENIRIFKVV